MKFLIFVCLVCFLSADGSPREKLLLKGRWEKIDYKIKGEWKILVEGEEKQRKIFFVLDDKFETTMGPDLYVVFSTNRLSLVNNDNTLQGAKLVGKLESKRKGFFRKMGGAQKFEIGKDLVLEKYRSVLIYCVKFSHLWGGASLNF